MNDLALRVGARRTGEREIEAAIDGPTRARCGSNSASTAATGCGGGCAIPSGTILLDSGGGYDDRSGARDGIESVKRNAPNANLT